MLLAKVNQNDLDRCKYGVCKQHSKDPEDRGHQQLHRQKNSGSEVDRSPGDEGHDDISVDVMHQEIDDDAPDPPIWAGAETDCDH